MILSDQRVEKLINHSNFILSIFNFSDNDKDHIISISDDNLLKEWEFINKDIFLVENLERPDDDFLIENGHKINKDSRKFKGN